MNDKKIRNIYEDDKMFHVLICDDEIPTCTYIEQVLLNYANEKNINMTVELFFSGETLLEYMEHNKNIDLIFLDILLPGNDGAQIGKILRNELDNEMVQIVYISSKENYAMQLFQVRPFDFLIKPLDKDVIISIFEKYRRIYGNNYNFFRYMVGRRHEKILLSEIMYFMCEQRKIYIVTAKEKIPFYGNMKEMHQTFRAEGFWSVHISYIINVKYVKKFREKEIVMCNDNIIPISYAYRKIIREKVLELEEK
mgnify:CR=1 FL=1